MKINHLIIAHLYQPGTAATNRIIAYVKGFAVHGVDVSLVLGNEKTYTTPTIEGDAKISVFFVQAPHGYKLDRAMAIKVKELYKENTSAILIYGSPVLCWFLPKYKYNIFYECTEIPFYGRKKTFQSRIKEVIKDYLSHRATGMFVISKALENYFRQKGISNIAIINMFVDYERFENVTSESKDKYIAYCGTISPFKDGVDCLIKAFALFISTHSDYTLKLIGRFESSAAEKTLKGLVESLNVVEKVEFAGMVKPADMPKLLCSAQMLALARPDNEQAKYGFPTKLGEYLATGKPVVVTNVGEIGDFLTDKYNCRMTEPGNPEAFAKCLSWVAENFDEALEIGRRGKELTMNAFSSQKQSIKALSFIEKLMI